MATLGVFRRGVNLLVCRDPCEIRPTLSLDGAAASPWDVLVVGAGPAGALAARQAAANGRRTLLVDRATFPRFKVCGGCLNLSALDTLKRAGLSAAVMELGAPSVAFIELAAGRRRARLTLPGGLSVSREALDPLLVRAAIDAGAEFLDDTRAHVGACEPGARCVVLQHGADARTTRAGVVLLASGLGSVPQSIDGAPSAQTIAVDSRIGAGCVTDLADPAFRTGTIYMAHGRHGYVGVVRVERDRLNLAAALDPSYVKRCGGLGEAALLVLEEAGCRPSPAIAEQAWRGTPLLTRTAGCVAAERLLLVGDAAGYVEPFTGEGMSWALAAGAAAAQLVSDGSLVHWDAGVEQRWTRLHRQLIANRQRLCRAVAWWLRRPVLCRAALQLLALHPRIARPLITRLNQPYKVSP